MLHNGSLVHRLSLCLRLLSSLTEPYSDTLPILVRAVSSAVWSGNSDWVASVLSEDLLRYVCRPQSHFTQPVYTSSLSRALAEVAISSAMESPLKVAFNSLLCALCSHTPHHFTLLLDRCLTALSDTTSPHLHHDLSPLLFTLAHAAQSSLCCPILLSSLLLTSIMAELCSTFTSLALCVTESPAEHEDSTPSNLSALLPRSCAFLAFLTDFSREWIPAKEWLGRDQQSSLWPHLLQFLSLAEYQHPPFISPLELRFVQDVGIEFFRAVLQGSADNKSLFSCLLTNSIYGSYSLEKAHLRTPLLTAFIYRLLIELVLDPEPVTIILHPLLNSPAAAPLLPLSLSLTYKAPLFHPSLPISQHSYLVSLPASLPISHLITLCQSHTTQSRATSLKQPLSTDSGTHVISFESKKSGHHHHHHHQKLGLQGGRSETPKSILKPVAPAPHISLSLPSSPDSSLPPETKLSELMTSSSSPLFALSLSLNIKPPSTAADEQGASPTPFSPSLPPLPSLLEAFTASGGLVPLAICLPALYPNLWPRKERDQQEGEGEMTDSEKMEMTTSHVTPFSLTATPNSLPRHALVTFGLCLRLRYYGDALIKHYPKARNLLVMLMGAESKGQH